MALAGLRRRRPMLGCRVRRSWARGQGDDREPRDLGNQLPRAPIDGCGPGTADHRMDLADRRSPPIAHRISAEGHREQRVAGEVSQRRGARGRLRRPVDGDQSWKRRDFRRPGGQRSVDGVDQQSPVQSDSGCVGSRDRMAWVSAGAGGRSRREESPGLCGHGAGRACRRRCFESASTDRNLASGGRPDERLQGCPRPG